MYSESISRLDMKDIKDADIVFIGIFTYAAVRGYKIASYLRKHTLKKSKASWKRSAGC